MERKFKSGKEFEKKFISYLEYCEENQRFANIAGFCVFCDMHKDTFYAQRDYYSDSFKKVNDALEDNVLQSRDITTKIFYLKNKFGYRDRIETENTNNSTNKNIDLSHLTTEQIKEILNSEA